MKKKILLIGSGGHARVVIDALERLDYDLKGIIDLNYKKSKELILGYKVIGNYEKLKNPYISEFENKYNYDEIEDLYLK